MREGNGALTVNTFQHHVVLLSAINLFIMHVYFHNVCRPWRECGISSYRHKLKLIVIIVYMYTIFVKVIVNNNYCQTHL